MPTAWILLLDSCHDSRKIIDTVSESVEISSNLHIAKQSGPDGHESFELLSTDSEPVFSYNNSLNVSKGNGKVTCANSHLWESFANQHLVRLPVWYKLFNSTWHYQIIYYSVKWLDLLDNCSNVKFNKSNNLLDRENLAFFIGPWMCLKQNLLRNPI